MSIIVGEHPIHMTVVVVQGSTADLVVPAANPAALAAPVLEFTADLAGEPSVTHALVMESGEWVVHLSSVQVAALAGLHFARVKDAGRVVAAGQVQHNHGWCGRSESRVVTTRIIWGGDGVTDHGALAGLTDDDHAIYALADGTRGDFAPTAHSHAVADVTGLQGALDGKQAAGNYAPTAHDHDDRYYTEAEVDTLLSGTLRGTGSPLGVVSAPPGTKYIDQNGTFGAWEWIKTSGTGTTGWEVSHGDTGWIDVTHLLTGLSPDNVGKLALRRLSGGTTWARFGDLRLEPGNGAATLADASLPSWARAEARTALTVFRGNSVDFVQQLVVDTTTIWWRSEWSIATGTVTRDRPPVGIRGVVQWATTYIPWPTTLAV